MFYRLLNDHSCCIQCYLENKHIFIGPAKSPKPLFSAGVQVSMLNNGDYFQTSNEFEKSRISSNSMFLRRCRGRQQPHLALTAHERNICVPSICSTSGFLTPPPLSANTGAVLYLKVEQQQQRDADQPTPTPANRRSIFSL